MLACADEDTCMTVAAPVPSVEIIIILVLMADFVCTNACALGFSLNIFVTYPQH